jgi:hypothetical protein
MLAEVGHHDLPSPIRASRSFVAFAGEGSLQLIDVGSGNIARVEGQVVQHCSTRTSWIGVQMHQQDHVVRFVSESSVSEVPCPFSAQDTVVMLSNQAQNLAVQRNGEIWQIDCDEVKMKASLNLPIAMAWI